MIKLNGIGPQKGGQMDRHELMEFLKGANINVTQNNIATTVAPAPYDSNIAAYVDGRFSEIESHQASSKAMIENEGDEN